MPDFSQPRMIKPELVIVDTEVSRPLEVKISKGEPQEEDEQ